MDYRQLILLIMAFLNGWMALRVLRRNARNVGNIFFALLEFSIALWSLSLFFFLRAVTEKMMVLSMQLTHLFGVIIATSLLLFALRIYFRKFHVFYYACFGFFLPTVLIVIIFYPHVLVQGAFKQRVENTVILGAVAHSIFALFFYAYFITGLVLLFRIWRASTRLLRKQMLPLTVGIAIAGFLATTTNIILVSPFIHYQRLIWLGPLFTTAMVIGVHRAYHFYFGIPLAASAVRMIE